MCIKRCDLFRYITYKKENGKKTIFNISYANAFNYSNAITGLTTKDKLGTYDLHIDRGTGLLDKSQKMIFENDYVENDDGKKYLVEWCQDKLCFVLRTDDPDDTLESLDITWQIWSVVGNVYENNNVE